MVEIREIEVERRGGGVTALLAFVAVAIIAAAAYFLVFNEKRETNAVTGAAKEVSQAAESVADSAKEK